MYSGVMSRQHPAIGRQIQNKPTVFVEAATELPQGAVLIDVAMAQNVGTEDHGKGTVGEGKGIDRSGTDWPCALGGCPSAGLLVSVKPEQGAIGVLRRQLGQEPACPATRIQDRPVPGFARYSMTGKRQQVSVIGGKPPHLILDVVELVIFGTFHVKWELFSSAAANPERLLSRPYSGV